MTGSSINGPASFPPSPPSAKSLAEEARPLRHSPVVDRSKVDPAEVKAAEGMEALFLDYMMKVMRQSVPKNDMDLESPATDIYRGMQDTEYAEKAARTGGIGLADQIIAYWESQRYNLPQGNGFHPASTGGTHEDQSDRK